MGVRQYHPVVCGAWHRHGTGSEPPENLRIASGGCSGPNFPQITKFTNLLAIAEATMGKQEKKFAFTKRKLEALAPPSKGRTYYQDKGTEGLTCA